MTFSFYGTNTKKIKIQSEKLGYLEINIPREWDELLIEVTFERNERMNFIDTVYYNGKLHYKNEEYLIDGAKHYESNCPTLNLLSCYYAESCSIPRRNS